MEKELTNGLMVLTIQENGFKTRSQGRENTIGLMVGCMLGIGKIVKCMVGESIHGVMEENTKVTIEMILNMGLEPIGGLMVGSMKEIGKRENSMA